MMLRFYLNLAVRNLLRHKRRTLLTALAISVGIFFFIVLDSTLLGFDRDAMNNIVDFETGDLQVMTAETADRKMPELKNLIQEADELSGSLAALPEVKAAEPRLFFPITISNGLEEIPLLGVGVEPKTGGGVFATSRYVTEGRWLAPGRAEAVLGPGIARLLDLKVGDSVTIRMQTATMTFQALDLTLVGLVATPNQIVNQNQLFVPLDLAREAVAAGGSATQIAVRLHDPERLGETAERIRHLPGLGPGVTVRTWRESAAAFIEMMKAERAYDSVFLLLVMVISVIGVVNTILLASLERVREIGLLKALGMTEADIKWVFMAEGIILGLVGGLIGTILAIPMDLYLVEVGYNLTAFFGEMARDLDYPIGDTIYGAWNWATMFWAVVSAVVVSLAASFFPARKAARLDPVESLRRV